MRSTQVADRPLPNGKFICRDWVIAGVIPLKLTIPMNQPRTLQLSRDEQICLAGMAMFALSLVLPAAKMGSGPTFGIAWFVMGTILSLTPNGTEASSLSVIALFMNVGCIVAILACFSRFHLPTLDVTVAAVCGFCALILLFRPYSGFEQLYVGYYLWLSSTVVIAVVPVAKRLLLGQSVKTG